LQVFWIYLPRNEELTKEILGSNNSSSTGKTKQTCSGQYEKLVLHINKKEDKQLMFIFLLVLQNK